MNPDEAIALTQSPPIILTRGLTKRFQDFVAVDHLDLAIGKGEVVGFIGPN